jgi:hypothetical protein
LGVSDSSAAADPGAAGSYLAESAQLAEVDVAVLE